MLLVDQSGAAGYRGYDGRHDRRRHGVDGLRPAAGQRYLRLALTS